MKFNQTELDKLFRYCFALTQKEDAAFDLLQSSLEKFLKKPPYELISENNYIRIIIRNNFIDQYRKDARYQFETFNEETGNFTDFDIKTLETIIINEDEVEKILQLLSPLDREILYLWSVEGYSTDQLSQILKIPKGTILSRITRLRVKIIHEYSDIKESAS
jgi:RNA polymerase sigma-70 factor, ECF subfamily